MTLSLTAALLWLIAANLTGMLPSKRQHWPQAYVLIALGLPILAWVWVDTGWIAALLCLAGAASVLRWPLRYLARWLGRTFAGRAR